MLNPVDQIIKVSVPYSGLIFYSSSIAGVSNRMRQTGFRPLFGAYFFIFTAEEIEASMKFPSPIRGLFFHLFVVHRKELCQQFPSPSRGLFFHNATEEAAAKWRAVSVPFSGLSFLLSVKKWQPENLDQRFPSPSWSLVFIQPLKLKFPPKNLWFPSPTWGLVFML